MIPPFRRRRPVEPPPPPALDPLAAALGASLPAEAATPEIRSILAAYRERQRRRQLEIPAAPRDVLPNVAQQVGAPFSTVPPPTVGRAAPRDEATRLAELDAQQEIDAAARLGTASKLPRDVQAAGGLVQGTEGPDRPILDTPTLRRVAIGAGRRGGALFEATVARPLLGTPEGEASTSRYGRGVARLERLESEHLYKPGAPETVGGLIGTLPELGLAEQMVAGPVSRALYRRLVARSANPLTRATIQGAGHTAALLGSSASIGTTAEEVARGTPLPQAASRGLESGLEAIDPRHPLNAAFYAGGILGAVGSVAGKLKVGRERVGYADRLATVRNERAARARGEPFQPPLPSDRPAAAPRTGIEALAQEAAQLTALRERTPEQVARLREVSGILRDYGETLPPTVSRETGAAEGRGAPENAPPSEFILNPREYTERVAEARRTPRPSVIPPSEPLPPRRGVRLPEGAPEILGGTEAEMAAAAPRRGQPGVLGSGPILAALRGRRASIAGGVVGGAVGAAAPADSPEQRLVNALFGATAVSGGAASLAEAGRRGPLRSGPIIPDDAISGPHDVSPRGVGEFRSRMRDVITNAPFQKGTAEQWRAVLQKGVNQAEVRDTGLGAFLDTKKGQVVTRDELLRAARPLGVQEYRFGSDDPEVERLGRAYRDADDVRFRARNALVNNLGEMGVPHPHAVAAQIADNALAGRDLEHPPRDGRAAAPIPADLLPAAHAYYDAVKGEFAANQAREAHMGGDPQYANDDYQLPGGDNYREVVVTAPPVGGGEPFTSGHYSSLKNLLSWMRLTDREIEGKPTVFAEEYQSDVHQRARARGYRDVEAEKAAVATRDAANAEVDRVEEHYTKLLTDHLTVDRVQQLPEEDGGGQRAPVFIGPVEVGWLQRDTPAHYSPWYFRSPAFDENTGISGLGGALDAVRTRLGDRTRPDNAYAMLQAVHDKADLGAAMPGAFLHGDAPETAVEWAFRAMGNWREAEAAVGEARAVHSRAQGGLPPLPFARTDDWLGLMLRRQLAEAVAQGKDQIGWTKAVQQADRWSQQVQERIDHVRWDRVRGQLTFYRGGERVAVPEEAGRAKTVEDVEGIVGKDIAKQLAASADANATQTASGNYTGQGIGEVRGANLTIGADFFRYIYDTKMPQVARELLKKLGIKGVEPHLADLPEAQRTGLSPGAVRAAAQEVRGGLSDFLDGVYQRVIDATPLDRETLDQAIQDERNAWWDQAYERAREDYEPEIPDLDWFEEGARDYIDSEYGEPARQLLEEMAGPGRAGGQERARTQGEWRDLWDEHRTVSASDAADDVARAIDEATDRQDNRATREQVLRELEALVDDRVTQQAEHDRENYEPEPPEDSQFEDQATQEADEISRRAERELQDLGPGGGEPGQVWVLPIPPEFRAKIQSGEGTFLYSGFDPALLKKLGLPLASAAIGAGAGAVADKKHPLRGAAVGAALGFAGGKIGRALRERRGPQPRGAAAVMPVAEPPIRGPVEPPAVRPDLRLVPGPEPEPARHAAQPGGLPVEPRVVPTDYANFGKFDVDPTGATRLAAEVERVVTEQGIHPKAVVSHAQVRQAAAALGVDIDAGGVQVNRNVSGAKLLAIRNIISANIAAAEQMAGELARPTAIPLERANELTRRMAVLDAQNAHLLDQFVRARTAAGRELNALKIVAHRTLDPAVWWAKARQVAGRDLAPEELVRIRRFVEERDRAGLIGYVQALRRTSVPDQLVTLWKAGLLTNPKTHIVNIVGNTAMAALETAKDPVAAGADWLLSLRTRQRTKGGVNRHLVAASIRGARQGLAEAREVLKGRAVGENLERGGGHGETTIDLPGLGKGANALLDGYQRYIYRALGASDRVFYQMALQRSLAEQAQVVGRDMGLRGVKLREYVQEIQRGEGALADQITAQAIKDADVATFHDRTRLGNAAAAFAREVPGGQFIVPFQRTPGAVATRVLEYSPLGLGKGLVDAVRVGLQGKRAPAALQRMAAEELGRGATGSGVIALGYWLAHYDLMTGAAPTTGSQDRQAWMQEGRRPNALHLGGQWVEVGRLSPLGNLLALGANLRVAMETPKTADLGGRAAEVAFSGLRTVADQPFVTGASAALAALQEPEKEAARFAQGMAGSVVPAVVGAAARGTDVARVPELEAAGPLSGMAGAVAERIPGVRQSLPPRRDTFGQRVPSRGLLSAMFTPWTASPDLKADPVIAELADAQYAVPRLPRYPAEGGQAYSQRQRLYGLATRQAVEQVVASPEYAAAKAAEAAAVASARAAATDPRMQRYSFEQLRDAALAVLTEQRGAQTRGELLAQAVQRVRRSLKAQIQ